MKIHEPDWAGEVLRCEKCSVQFTLEAGDEKKVKFIEKFTNGYARHSVKCPKCRRVVLFSIDATKEKDLSPSVEFMPAPIPPEQ